MNETGTFFLPSIISNGMILQRKKPIRIWGWDLPGQLVTVTFLDQEREVTVEKDGQWLVQFDEQDAGGPFELNIAGSETRKITDVYIGEVWLASGQSNMELPLGRTLDLYEEEIKTMQYPLIREFHVPIEYDFSKPLDRSLLSAEWKAATVEHAASFSAVATFFAIRLQKELNIPVGIVMTAVGGTPIEAWMHEEDLAHSTSHLEELAVLRTPNWIANTLRSDEQRVQAWYEEVSNQEAYEKIREVYPKPEFIDSDWEEVEMPNLFGETIVGGNPGAIWLRKVFFVDSIQHFSAKSLLRLGAIIDYDEVWLNGVQVGKTEYRYPPRRYEVPNGIIQEGWNTVCVRVLINGMNGGWISGKGKEYCLEGIDKKIDLSGKWKAIRTVTLEPLAPMTFIQYKPTGLYNAMLHPLRNVAISGFLFYQGESNTGSPSGYSEQMKRLIHRWRTTWNDFELPFLYVQLANYLDPLAVADDRKWAELRLEQALVERMVPNTAMTVAIDVGEANDLHPQNKKTIGERLAEDALAMMKGAPVVPKSVSLIEFSMKDGVVRLSFDKEFEPTTTKVECLEGIEWNIYEAEVQRNSIELSVQPNHMITAVRYAYWNNPISNQIYTKYGYPLGTELWQLVEGGTNEAQ